MSWRTTALAALLAFGAFVSLVDAVLRAGDVPVSGLDIAFMIALAVAVLIAVSVTVAGVKPRPRGRRRRGSRERGR